MGGAFVLLSSIAAVDSGRSDVATAGQSRAAPSVRVRLVRARESTALRVVLLVRVEGAGMVLGAYEGRLQFDPGVFAIDSVTAGRDGSRYVNPGDAARGTIRFAGFTPTGFSSTDAVRIVGRALRPIEEARLTATLAVAGDLLGKPVPKAGLIGATTIEAASR